MERDLEMRTSKKASGEPERTVRVLSLIHAPPAQNAPAPAKAGAGRLMQTVNRLTVNVYKVVGFAILTVIVLGLLSFLATSLFYAASRTWTVPTVVSPTDDRVVQLKVRLTDQQAQVDKLLADMRDADRIIASQEEFQNAFRGALKADLDERKGELSRLRALSHHYASTRTQIERSNRDYSGFSRDRMQREYEAHLIDRDAMMQGSYQLAQIANANLSLAEKETELGTRTNELSRESQSLEQALSKGNQNLSYEVLRMTEDYRRSVLETDKAKDNRAVLQKTAERYQQMVDVLQASPYLRAAEHRATLAFAPYENIQGVAPGSPMYGCSLEMIGCRKVGTVVSVVPGEVTGRHPHRNEELRGQMLEIALTDPQWGEARVLFIGGAPMGI